MTHPCLEIFQNEGSPKINITSISLSINQDNIGVDMPYQSILLKYQKLDNNCYITNAKLDGILLEIQDFRKLFLEDLKLILKNQKLPINSFYVYFQLWSLDGPENQEQLAVEFLEMLKNHLESWLGSQKIPAKRLNLGIASQKEITSIVPFLDPKYLRCLEISNARYPNDNSIDIKELLDSEQFKKLKMLSMSKLIVDVPWESFAHLEKCSIRWQFFRKEDLEKLRELFLNTPTMISFQISTQHIDSYDKQSKTGAPNISECAQDTVLVWIPTIFFLITLPFLTAQCYLTAQRFSRLSFSFHFNIKLGLTAFLAANSLFTWCYVLFSTTIFAPTGTFILHLIRLRCGLVSSGVQHITAIIFTACGAPEFYQRIWMNQDNSVLSVAYLSWYSALLLYTFFMCFADSMSEVKEGAQCPELHSSFLNRLTLWWFNRIPMTGAKHDLEIEDLYELDGQMSTEYLSKLWESIWEPKRQRYLHEMSIWLKKDSSERTTLVTLPSVVFTLFRMFQWEFLLASVLKFILDTLQFSSPFLLQ
ncbi:hypothetical protein CAEBREN_10267 [Caenorhabditis brenneri]|uniref:DUF38 domain-containing protein n=1 Tax=Caenorhabditis brenneri TaxID=135651 RepID=G0PIA3_CAEBE|nr:hypothetical protein CAEBREN_10267 [Caenorhabditis brenneri]